MFRTPVISLTLFCLPLFFGGTRALGHGGTRLHTGFGGSSQPRNTVLHKTSELWQESDSLYWLTVNGGNKASGWRLPYPVYQFQTGDVDGDGSEDAMVGVVKATRYWPLGRRLFIFKQIDGTGRAGKPVKKRPPVVVRFEIRRYPRGLPLCGPCRGRQHGADKGPGVDSRLALCSIRLQVGRLRHEVRPLDYKRSGQRDRSPALLRPGDGSPLPDRQINQQLNT